MAKPQVCQLGIHYHDISQLFMLHVKARAFDMDLKIQNISDVLAVCLMIDNRRNHGLVLRSFSSPSCGPGKLELQSYIGLFHMIHKWQQL